MVQQSIQVQVRNPLISHVTSVKCGGVVCWLIGMVPFKCCDLLRLFQVCELQLLVMLEYRLSGVRNTGDEGSCLLLTALAHGMTVIQLCGAAIEKDGKKGPTILRILLVEREDTANQQKGQLMSPPAIRSIRAKICNSLVYFHD